MAQYLQVRPAMMNNVNVPHYIGGVSTPWGQLSKRIFFFAKFKDGIVELILLKKKKCDKVPKQRQYKLHQT